MRRISPWNLGLLFGGVVHSWVLNLKLLYTVPRLQARRLRAFARSTERTRQASLTPTDALGPQVWSFFSCGSCISWFEMSTQPDTFRDRVIAAAEAALKASRSVGPLELFQQMGLLQPVHVDGWRKGDEHTKIDESLIQGTGRFEARAVARDQIDQVLARWSRS